MTPDDLLAELAARGVIVARSGDRLLIDAPKGVVSPDLRERLRQEKVALLAALGEPDAENPAVGEPDVRDLGDTGRNLAGASPNGTGRRPAEPIANQAMPPVPWRGVLTCWAKERGWLAVRDPWTGEWHEIPGRGAPPGWFPKRTT